jgi:hypothetical protein
LPPADFYLDDIPNRIDATEYAAAPAPENIQTVLTFVNARNTEMIGLFLCRANSLLTGKITGNCAFSALS